MDPLEIARRQARAREVASLRAALKVLDALDYTVVQPAQQMNMTEFRKHISVRHPGTFPEFMDHAIDHRTRPGLGHHHEGEPIL